MTNTVITPQAGIDFTQTYAPPSSATPEYPGLPMFPGTQAWGTNGSRYIFVKATTNVLNGRVVLFTDFTTWEVRQITNTLARAAFGSPVGVVAGNQPISGTSPGIATGYYGWVQVAGYVDNAQFNTGSTAFTQAHTAATGVLMDTTGSAGVSAAVNGIVLLATAAGNSAAAILNSPTVGAND